MFTLIYLEGIFVTAMLSKIAYECGWNGRCMFAFVLSGLCVGTGVFESIVFSNMDTYCVCVTFCTWILMSAIINFTTAILIWYNLDDIFEGRTHCSVLLICAGQICTAVWAFDVYYGEMCQKFNEFLLWPRVIILIHFVKGWIFVAIISVIFIIVGMKNMMQFCGDMWRIFGPSIRLIVTCCEPRMDNRNMSISV